MKQAKHFAALVTAVALVTLPGAALAETVKLTATLNGAAETAGGDPDGTGRFTVEIDADAGDFCYSLSATKIAKPTMAHVHEGAAGTDGKPLGSLVVADDMCIALTTEVLKAIVAAPGNYYINIHTADFPVGAVRGQLVAKPG